MFFCNTDLTNCGPNYECRFKALELWKSADEGNQKLFEAYLKKRGIYQVKDTSMTGIGKLLLASQIACLLSRLIT